MIVLAIALLVGVGLAEVLTRLVSPQVTMFPRYVTSPDYAFEFPRNATIRNARGNLWAFTYTTNDIGRRGPFVTPAVTDDVPNLVLVGDSYTFGIGVDDGDVYSAHLQNLLGNAWRVVNGGMPAWGIDSEIKWFYRTGARYKPRVVVLQFCGNDPWDSNTGVTTVADGQFEFHPVPISEQKPAWMVWASQSRLLQSSHLYSLLRSVMPDGGAGDFNLRVLGTGSRGDPGTGASARQTRQELQYLEYLRTFAERLSDDGIPLLLLSVTHDGKSGHTYDLVTYPLIEAGVRRLEEEGLLRFVELPLSQMQKYKGSPEGHRWGPEHHRLVAEALAAALRDS